MSNFSANNIIGISAFYHNSSCALIQDGKITAAAEEERFTRVKFDHRVPRNSYRYCLEQAHARSTDVDLIAFYEEPVKKVGRIISSISDGSEKPNAILNKWSDKLHTKETLASQLDYDGPIKFYPHHLSHAAASYALSSFEDAAFLVADGVGEWSTTTIGMVKRGKFEIIDEIVFPHSLGLFYSAITSFLGFQVNSDEYKVMGLASYGTTSQLKKLREIISLNPDGSFELDMNYFDYSTRMFSDKFIELFGIEPRSKGSEIKNIHMDIACSAQRLVEESLLALSQRLHNLTGLDNLCLSGGVSLNCVANAKISSQGPFKNVFIPFGAGDEGGSIGAAALAHYEHNGFKSNPISSTAYLGPRYEGKSIQRYLNNIGLTYEVLDEEHAPSKVANLLSNGAVIGWFNGRMEFGPRALGSRSILANPKTKEMKDHVNKLIKGREEFRPFAPICLEDQAENFFETKDKPYPYMTEVVSVKRPESLGAITHIDQSARLQTLNQKQNPMLVSVLKEFQSLTGIPVLLNTSFNKAGEPIVCTPFDAINTFREGLLDYLYIEGCLISRKDQPRDLVEPGTHRYYFIGRDAANNIQTTYFFS